MNKLTKEQFDELFEKSKSRDDAKVSDLILMLKPFEDYYLYDPRCHYCGGDLYITNNLDANERPKLCRDLVNFCDGPGGTTSLYEFLIGKNNE
jgi:hypothetical protein